MADINLTFTKQQLQAYARDADREYRHQDGVEGLAHKQATWHGRLSREIQVIVGKDRDRQKQDYRAAHTAVLDSLRAIYGQEIGEKAFRAGFGHAGKNGTWQTNESAPITGRHIQTMLATAEREIGDNASLVKWIAAVRDDGREPTDRLLGTKVTTPRPDVHVSRVYVHISDDLRVDMREWLARQDAKSPKRGFWVLDVESRHGTHARIGIHVDSKNPGVVQVRGRDGVVHETDMDHLHETLRDQVPRSFLSDVVTIAGYRAEEISTRKWLGQTQRALERFGDSLVDQRHGVKDWVGQALDKIAESRRVLRANNEGKLSQLAADIDGLLADLKGLVSSDLKKGEIKALGDGLKPFLQGRLGELFVAEAGVMAGIVTALEVKAWDFMIELRDRGGSLGDATEQRALREALVGELDRLLSLRAWPEARRQDVCGGLGEALEGWLARLGEETITPLRQQEAPIQDLCNEIVRKLETRRAKLEAKLEVPRPAELRFTRQGEEVVATIPNLFSARPPKQEPAQDPSSGDVPLTWETLVQHHQERLGDDPSGVPGLGRLRQISEPVRQRAAQTQLTLQVGPGDPAPIEGDQPLILGLHQIEDPDGGIGDILALEDDRVAGLSRFLNDGAFQEAYAQAVQRFYPPGTPTEARNVAITVAARREGETQKRVFDITFRAPLPGGPFAYQVLEPQEPEPGEQPIGLTEDAPTQRAVGGDLTLTLHVPYDQVQLEHPQFTLDEPGLVLRTPPHNLGEFEFQDAGDRKVADIAGLVPDVDIRDHNDIGFNAKLRVSAVEGTGNALGHLTDHIENRGNMTLLAHGEGVRDMEAAATVREQLGTVRSTIEGHAELQLNERRTWQVTRFLAVEVFDSYYRKTIEQLEGRTPDETERPPVQFEVVATGSDDDLWFDIEMRGPLPEGLGVNHRDLDGEELDLVVHLRVPMDDLGALEPRRIIVPTIETRRP